MQQCSIVEVCWVFCVAFFSACIFSTHFISRTARIKLVAHIRWELKHVRSSQWASQASNCCLGGAVCDTYDLWPTSGSHFQDFAPHCLLLCILYIDAYMHVCTYRILPSFWGFWRSNLDLRYFDLETWGPTWVSFGTACGLEHSENFHLSTSCAILCHTCHTCHLVWILLNLFFSIKKI